MLSACGGGSGGSSQTAGGGATPTPAPGGGFSVSIDRSELRFSGEEGGNIMPKVVLGSGTGTPPDALFLGSLDLGTGIQQMTVEIIGTQAKFTIYPKLYLPAGEHRGTLQLFACRDKDCNSQFPGSPATVPYVITVTKGMTVTPSSIQLSAVSGATATSTFAVQLATGQSSFTATTNSPWLTVSNVTSSGFSVTTKAMPPGNYSGTVSVTVADRTRDVPVSYVVTGDGSTVTRVTPDVSSLSFNATTSATAPSRVVNVTLPSWSKELSVELRYLTVTNGWLTATKTGERSVTVTASAASIAPGNYQAELILKSDSMATPATVPVNFSVGEISWSVAGQSRFAVGGDSTAAALAGDLSIGLPNLPPQAYTLSASAPWLKLSRTSGTTGDAAVRASIDVAEMLKLANFATYTADITIKAADTRIPATKFTVTLEKAVPELHYVSPHTRMPGEAGSFILRGRGLNSVANLEQALKVNGATPVSMTRVNDTEVKFSLPAAAGNVSFSLSNALGVATGAPVLHTVAPQAFSYAAIATAGHKGSLVFDPERQAVFTANKSMHSVMRFAWNGSGWTVSSASLPSVEAVALAPDGKSLVASSTAGNIVLLDPVTLQTQGSYKAMSVSGYELNSLPRLAVTNDGRAYFEGSVEGGGMAYFDLVTRQFGGLQSQRFNFYSGPWFSVSGDGSRLNIVQSASVSPSPPMLYMDNSDRTPKVNPAGMEFWYEAAQSLRGERFVEGTYKVWDRDFALIGNLALPSDYFGRTPVLSPDGSRVYLLAYNSMFSYGAAAVTPRVFVFDSSTRAVQSTNLPLLGYFDIADYPTCRDSAYECNTRAQGAISPDGKTLFFVGNSKLVVAPIPALTMASQRASQRAGSARQGGAPVMTQVPTGR